MSWQTEVTFTTGPALFCDCGVAYKTPYLLTYLLTYVLACLLTYQTRRKLQKSWPDQIWLAGQSTRPVNVHDLTVTALTWRQRPVEVLRMRFSCHSDIRFQPNTPGVHTIIGDPSSDVDRRPLVHAAGQTSSSAIQNSVSRRASTSHC